MKHTRHTKKRQKKRQKTGQKKRGGQTSKKQTDSKECRILDEQLPYKSNNIWKTCIYQNGKNIIYYITPKNVIVKSISTYQIPKFVLNVNGAENQFKIKIDDQFVSCFIYLHSQWYAITIIANSFIFENIRYYRVNNLFRLDATGKLHFAKVANEIINVDKKYYSPVSTKSETYNLLNNFTTQKLIARDVKEIVAVDVGTSFLDELNLF